IEIIAFNEPLEYLPSDKWNSQFENVSTDKMLRVSKEIPTITGATLSARSITDGSRVAFAFYNEVLRDK
ncbi:MAG: FMN-binding protein, partial [Sulfurimonas sp.]|nr:FMN-binding protein [Sulfurimonas sp.]